MFTQSPRLARLWVSWLPITHMASDRNQGCGQCQYTARGGTHAAKMALCLSNEAPYSFNRFRAIVVYAVTAAWEPVGKRRYEQLSQGGKIAAVSVNRVVTTGGLDRSSAAAMNRAG